MNDEKSMAQIDSPHSVSGKPASLTELTCCLESVNYNNYRNVNRLESLVNKLIGQDEAIAKTQGEITEHGIMTRLEKAIHTNAAQSEKVSILINILSEILGVDPEG